MKKITIIFIAMLSFCWQSYSQDTCGTATPVTPGTITGTIITGDTGSAEMTLPDGDNAAWFVYSATADGTISVNSCDGGADTDLAIGTGTCGALTDVQANDDACDLGSGDEWASEILGYPVSAGTDYYIEWSDEWSAGPFDWTLTYSPPAAVPENDDCVNAQSLIVEADLSCSSSVAGTTVAATESLSGCIGTANDDVWYLFEATGSDHTIIVSNTGGSSDIVTEVFDTCGGTSLVCQDSPNSPIALSGLTSGNTYYFRIYTWSSSVATTSDFTVCVGTPEEAPDNDECVNAEAVVCDDVIMGNSNGATDTDGNLRTEVWYSYTGTAVGETVTVSSCGSAYDTTLTVYDACSGTQIVTNDDNDEACGVDTLQSELSFVSDGSSAYVIKLEGFGTASGDFTLSVTCEAPPTCIPATFSLADGGNICPTDGGFIIDVDITALGTSTTVNILQDGVAVYSGVDGTASPYSIGGLFADTDYDITVEDAADDTCASTETFTTGVCPPPAPDNDECVNAEAVGCDDVLMGNSNGATDTDGNLRTEVWYSYTGTAVGETVTVSSCGSAYDTTLTVYDACSGTQIVTNDDNDEACGVDTLQSELSFVSDGSSTYVIKLEGFGTASGDFTLSVTCEAPPTCIPATFSLADGGNICPTDGGFIIDVDITALGTSTTVNILQDGVAVYSGVDGTASPYSIGGLFADTDYDITVEDAADDTCTSTQTFTTEECPPPPPANDDIAGAIDLPVGDTVCETEVTGTNVSATDSVENDNEASCSSFDPAGDVWFKVTVPSTGDLTIETSASDVDAIADTIMEVYSGTSGALVEIACDDDGGTSLFSLVELNGLTPGDVLLVRVWEFGDDSKGNFDICAWSPTTLGIDDNSFNGFSYYPNPVKNVLSLNSTKNIDTVEVFNMIGQRIISIDSNETIQNVDMAELQSGAYFVKVSIANQTKVIKVIKN